MASESDIKMASRLARAIASDLSIYNKDKIEQGLENDNVFEMIEDELDEGRALYAKKVPKEIVENMNLFERAIVDTIVASRKHVKAKIF